MRRAFARGEGRGSDDLDPFILQLSGACPFFGEAKESDLEAGSSQTRKEIKEVSLGATHTERLGDEEDPVTLQRCLEDRGLGTRDLALGALVVRK